MTDEQINAAIETVMHGNEHWILSRDYCNELDAIVDGSGGGRMTTQDIINDMRSNTITSMRAAADRLEEVQG